jgi:Glycosyl hydrolase catalytic core
VAYDIADPLDFAALSPGVSWWYNWGSQPNKAVPADYVAQYGMDYYPMVWGANFDATAIEAFLQAHTEIKYLLVLNEPSQTGQSNLTPQQAAVIWPNIEAIAAHSGVKIVGPQMSYGTMTNYTRPIDWLDAFIAAYQAANGGRSPQMDYLAFHWYDYGLDAQLNLLDKYGKQIWVTEMANWHTGDGNAAIDTLAKQEAQMTAMVALCESRSDVFRYAWFTGRWSNDVHFTSLLGTPGQLTDLGKLYLSLPYSAQ